MFLIKCFTDQLQQGIFFKKLLPTIATLKEINFEIFHDY